MNKEQFVKGINDLGIPITDEQLDQLDRFYQLLVEWNQKINLTTITSKEDIYLKHFYDSITLAKVCDLNHEISLCDVGSGAGFPGIVLKILFPNLKITLIDSLNKRVLYLTDVIEKLGLKNILAVHARMEEYSKIHVEQFDIITARAVASAAVLAEISVKALKVGGKLILMKANAEKELEEAFAAFEKLSLKMDKTLKFLLPFENSNRMLISIQKLKRTSEIYPRNIDKIRKYPL